jgi:hypothetical protein
VTLKALLFPRDTFPKLRLEALVLRSAVDAIPVPLKETVAGELEMSLITETLPDKVPAVFGEKTTLNVAFFPASMVSGSAIPETVTPAAVELACVTVRFDPPSFDTVTDCEALSPTATEPNLIASGATDIVAAVGVGAGCWTDEVLGAPAIPVHPDMERMAKNRATRAAAGIDFLPAEFAGVARSPAPLKLSFVVEFFIEAIVGFGNQAGLLAQGTFKVQGTKPAPGARVRREAAGRLRAKRYGPPNSIHFDVAPIYGTIAETSAEYALSTPVESTEVTT